jgi:hypothetical protein
MKKPVRQLLIRVVAIACIVPGVLAATDDWLNAVLGDPVDRYVRVIFALVVIVVACGPPIWLWVKDVRQTRRMRKSNEQRCRKCHYDLRAHKAGERCPECGTEIPTVPSATISGKPRSDR